MAERESLGEVLSLIFLIAMIVLCAFVFYDLRRIEPLDARITALEQQSETVEVEE